jgi:hypothetical protein
MPKHIHTKKSSHEYPGIHRNSGWCSVSVNEIICCDSLIYPLYLWAPMLRILLLCGSYTADATINPNALTEIQNDSFVIFSFDMP